MKVFRSLRTFSFAIIAVLGLSFTQPFFVKPAHATLAVDGSILGLYYPEDKLYHGPAPKWLQVAGQIVLCVVLLPICILDEEAGNAEMTKQDLLDNGYLEEEIDLILDDQKVIVENLENETLKLEISEQDDALTITDDLKTIYPKVSDTYVQFFLDYNAL